MSKGGKLLGLAALGAAAAGAVLYLKKNKEAADRFEDEFDDFIDDCEDGIDKCKQKIEPHVKKYADVATETASEVKDIADRKSVV